MSVDLAVNGLITDLDQLNRVYLQLCKVPREVQDLFRSLAGLRSRLVISTQLLAQVDLDELPPNDILAGQPMATFRNRLLDLELLINPDQLLHHSGLGFDNQHSVRWDSFEHGDSHEFCIHFKEHILGIIDEVSALNAFLNA